MQRSLSVAATTLAALFTATGASSCQWMFPYSAENLCETQVRAQCHFAFGCCNASERADGRGGTFTQFHTEDDCVRESMIFQCANYDAVIESQRAERFDLDEELLQACYGPRIEALNTCDAKAVIDPESDPDCEGVSLTSGEGKVADGELCFESFECATEGAVCKPNEPDDDEILVTSKGECEPPPQEGDPCPAFFCASGLYCDVSVGEPTCATKKPEGADCDASSECVSDNCEIDFAAGTETCAPKKDNGESCFSDGECKSDLCDFNTQTCTGAIDDGQEVVVDACDGLGTDEE